MAARQAPAPSALPASAANSTATQAAAAAAAEGGGPDTAAPGTAPAAQARRQPEDHTFEKAAYAPATDIEPAASSCNCGKHTCQADTATASDQEQQQLCLPLTITTFKRLSMQSDSSPQARPA